MALRREIRAAVVELLKGATAAGQRVSSSRSRAVWREGLPAIVVYTPREDLEVSIEAPREYLVQTDVVVELFVEETADGVPDELIDELEEDVWDALTADPSLGLDDVELVPTAFASSFNSETKRPIGGARLTWRAKHHREAPQGDAGEFGRFETAHVETDLAPPDGNPDAIDDVDAGG